MFWYVSVDSLVSVLKQHFPRCSASRRLLKNMAALSEPVPISVEARLCGVESGREEDTVILSNTKSFINTLKLSDQKLVTSVPVRVGVTISSPAVWNDNKQEFLLVQNKQDVCIWKEGQTLLDKVKNRHIPTDICKVFSLPSYDPIVLCQNGSVGFLSGGFKEECLKAVLTDDQSISWCSALDVKDGVCVLFTTQSTQEGSTALAVHSRWYTEQEDGWTHTSSPLHSHGALLSCACRLVQLGDGVHFFTLWDDGTLHEMLISETSFVEQGQPIAVKGVSAPCSLFCLSDNDFAVVGLGKKKKDGVAILDKKFGRIRAWQQFPFEGKFEKAFCQREHILVYCEKTLYAYRYDCQTATLASMMGQHQGALTAEERPPLSLNVSHKKKRKSSDNVENNDDTNELVRILTNLGDSVKTSSYTSFKRDFSLLRSKLPESAVWAYLGDLSTVLKRCCAEKRFWPAAELEFLISSSCVSPSDLVPLFEALLQHKDVDIMLKALTSQPEELPDACLCLALHCFLSASEEKVREAVERCGQDLSESAAVEDDDGVVCPFSKSRAFLVDQVLGCPFDEAYLVGSMRKLPFSLVVNLLKYLLYRLKHPMRTTDGDVEKENQLLLQMSRWEAVALDAHATQFIIAKDTHELVINFSEEEDKYVSFVTDANKELSEKLKLMMSKTAKLDKKVMGQYCIEVLHLL